MKRIFHWLGHVMFDMDCAVHNDHRRGFARCKACGREVSTLPKAWQKERK